MAEINIQPLSSPAPQALPLLRLSLMAGLGAGAILAMADMIVAIGSGAGLWGCLAALPVILALDISLGGLVGLLQAEVLEGWTDRDGFASTSARLRGLARSCLWPGDRQAEARRLAYGVTALLLLAAAGLALLDMALSFVPRVRADILMSFPLGLAAGAILLAGALMVSPLSRALTFLFSHLPLGSLVSLRSLLVLLILAAGGVMVVGRQTLQGFLRAVDLSPFLLAGLFLTANLTLLLVATIPHSRLYRLLAAGRKVHVLVAMVFLALLWLATLGPAGDSPGALKAYRGYAPLAGLLARGMSAALDFDRDGFSAYFGDGDCAPFDPDQGPGKREIPGNGLDDDCFDGDMAISADPFRPPPPYPLPAAFDRNLSFVVVLFDALRRDHLSHYGYHRPTAPHIDRLAKRSVAFDRAYAPSSYTFASFPAIMTSKFPTMLPRKVMRKKGRISPKEVTLALTMRQGGLRTAYVSDGGAFAGMGLAIGFQEGKAVNDNAEQVTDLALAQLKRLGQDRFFLWVDYISPHSPYRYHKDLPQFGTRLEDLYDQEILYADRAFGRLLTALEGPEYRDRVVLVVLADHGEAFGEHGTYYHGHNLHEENVRVPLLFAVPSVEPRMLTQEPVSLLDLYPTLVNLAGLKVPAHARGHDLSRAILTGEEEKDRHIFMESHFVGYGANLDYQAAVATKRTKLIDDWGTRTLRLYDLERDPGETRDLAGERPEELMGLRRILKIYQSYGE